MTKRSWAPRMGALRPERGKKKKWDWGGKGGGRMLQGQQLAWPASKIQTPLCHVAFNTVWGLWSAEIENIPVCVRLSADASYLSLLTSSCEINWFFFSFYMVSWFERTRGFVIIIDPNENHFLMALLEDFFDSALVCTWMGWGGGVEGLLFLYKLAIIHKFSIQKIIIWALHSRIQPTACFCRKSGKKFRCISQNLNWSPSLKAWVTGTELYLRWKCFYKMALAICACSLWNDWLNSKG